MMKKQKRNNKNVINPQRIIQYNTIYIAMYSKILNKK